MDKNKKRHLEKEKILLRWLLFFDFTNRKIVANLFDVTDGTLSRFYRSMQRKNLITMVQNPTAITNQKLITLTQDGFDFGLTLNNDIDINKVTLKRTIPPTLVRHQIALQMYLVNKKVDAFNVVSDKLLRKRNEPLAFIPDAIAIIDNQRVAIEMELTRKKPARIVYKYQQQAHAMRSSTNKRSLFDKVIFIFENESLMKTYKQHFDKERWDYCVVENHKVLVMHNANSELAFVLDEKLRNSFSFEVSNNLF